ncbi:hypothetical protein Tco_1255607 [Tanacetum coccineum]
MTLTRRSENHLNGGIDCISSFVPHSNWGSKSTKFDDLLRERRSKSMLLKTLQDMSGRLPLIVYEQNTSPKASQGRDSNGSREIRTVLDWKWPKKGESRQQWTASRRTSRRHQFEREASRALLQMRSLQNRPAKDGRVHIMEPRAREALKRPRDGGSVRAGEVKAGRMQTRLLPSESMLELDSAKMIIDAGSSDNIASTEMVDQLGPEEVKARLISYIRTHTYKPMDTGTYSISIGLLKSDLFRGTRAERRVTIFTSSFGLINQTPNQTPIDWEMLKGSCSNAKSLR